MLCCTGGVMKGVKETINFNHLINFQATIWFRVEAEGQ